MSRNIIVMLGPPCSGKSTCGKRYAIDNNMIYISSGDIARNMGDDILKSVNDGNLAPEDMMRNSIKNKVRLYDCDIILDGFPRFVDQFKYLKEKILRHDDKLIFVMIDTTMNKIINRSLCRGREDDNKIYKRLLWYVENTLPMIEYIVHNGEILITLNVVEESQYDAYNKMINLLHYYYNEGESK